jgi:hypothetical protein
VKKGNKKLGASDRKESCKEDASGIEYFYSLKKRHQYHDYQTLTTDGTSTKDGRKYNNEVSSMVAVVMIVNNTIWILASSSLRFSNAQTQA